MNARSRRAKYAAEHRHMRDRLTVAFAVLPEHVRAEGRDWYPSARRMVSELSEWAELPPDSVAGVIAALSPQQRWRENVAMAETILERKPVPGYLIANILKAERIANGEHPLDVLGGPKVRAFYANLTGDQDTVTVDVWAQRAATGLELPAPKIQRYERIANAYKAAAYAVGEHPCDFQAAVWLGVRPDAENEKDNRARKARMKSSKGTLRKPEQAPKPPILSNIYGEAGGPIIATLVRRPGANRAILRDAQGRLRTSIESDDPAMAAVRYIKAHRDEFVPDNGEDSQCAIVSDASTE